MIEKYNRNIPLMYASSFFSSLVFHRGIFILYLLEVGISNYEIGILQASLFWSNFLLEIPTGIFGDKIGRKWSIFIGSLLMIINGIGMAYTTSFFLFLSLFVMEGISIAFISGSNTALLYDSLKILKREGDYIRILSRISTISSILLGISMGIGGLLKEINWEIVYILYAVAVLISSIFVFFMYDNKSDIVIESNPIKITENTSIKRFFYTSHGRRLLLLLFSIGIYNSVMTPYYIYGQNLFKSFELKETYIALIFSVVQFSSGLMYLGAEKVSKLISFEKLMIITFIFSSFFMFFNIFDNIIIIITIFYIVMVFPDISEIITDNYIQEKIPSNLRASIISIKSFIESLFTGTGYMLFAILFDEIGIINTYVLMGLFPLISLFLFILYIKNYKTYIQELQPG